MPILKNVSPLGDLFIPGIGLVKAGAEFEATTDQADGLVKQTDNFERVTAKKKG